MEKQNKNEESKRYERMRAAIRSVMTKSSKGICTLHDAFWEEVSDMHGKNNIEFLRAIRACNFVKNGGSRKFIEELSRRKFRCDTSKNLDIGNFYHFLSYILEIASKEILCGTGENYKKVFVEHFPEILASMGPIERDEIDQRKAILLRNRKNRAERANQIKNTKIKKNVTANDVISPEVPMEIGAPIEPISPISISKEQVIAQFPSFFEQSLLAQQSIQQEVPKFLFPTITLKPEAVPEAPSSTEATDIAGLPAKPRQKIDFSGCLKESTTPESQDAIIPHTKVDRSGLLADAERAIEANRMQQLTPKTDPQSMWIS